MKSATVRWGKMITLILSVAGLGACKTTGSQGQGKSLDNMARGRSGDLTANQCGTGKQAQLADSTFIDQLLKTPGFLGFSDNFDSKAQPALVSEVKTALKSIPVPLQIGFVGFGGSIVITDKITKDCVTPAQRFASVDQTYVDTEDTGKINACWRPIMREADDADAQSTAKQSSSNQQDTSQSDIPAVRGSVIYVAANAEAIQHGLVRAFGYNFVQYMSNWRADSNDTAPVYGDQGPEFKAFKQSLTTAFLQDIAKSRQSSGAYDLSLFDQLLPKEIISANDPATVGTLWQNFRSGSSAVANDFEDYVFAEAFDSFYCSDATVATMQSDFSQTYQSFLEADEAIRSLVDYLPVVENPEQVSKAASEASQSQGSGAELALTSKKTKGKLDTVQAPAFGLRGFGIIAGLGRAIGGVARGVGRVGVGVARGAGQVVSGAGRVGVGLVQGAGRVVVGGVRVAGGFVRSSGQVIGRVASGTVRGAVNLMRGAGQVAAGAARGVGRVGSWVVNGTGQIIYGLFGPYLVLRGCNGFSCGNGFGLTEQSSGDYDNDGVPDASDLCSNTPKGSNVYKSGEWTGCASGQKRDRDVALILVNSYYQPNGDYDEDGIRNDMDRCSNTPAKKIQVHTDTEWMGCASGQRRDEDVLTQLANY